MEARADAPPYPAILFDCDSTLSTIEGIDELQEGLDAEARAKIRALTDAAMDGELPLEEAYGARLEVVRPSRAALEAVGRLYVETAVPRAVETVAALHSLGKRVEIVSGGIRQAVLTLAAHLGIVPERVHAVDVLFAEDGSYRDFDRSSPLARSGGKPEVARALAPDGRAALVGDGATDLEARPALSRFVCFAAVARREAVVGAADAVVEELDLARTLPHLLSKAELRSLEGGPHAGLVVS